MTVALQAEAARPSLAAWADEAAAAEQLAAIFAPTRFFPDSLRLRDDKNAIDWKGSIAQGAAAILTGQALGFDPMASLRSIDIIPPGSGQPALRAIALRALLQQHGHTLELIDVSNTRAIMRGKRKGDDWYPVNSEWTIDRARNLGVRGFNDPKGSWQRQPQVMLVARCTGEMARWIAADVLLGLPYLVEEIGDEGQDGGVVVPSTGGTGGPPPRPKRTARRTRPPAAALPAPQPEASSPPEGRSEPPGGQSEDTPAGQGDSPAGPGADHDQATMISPAQRARLWASLRRIGITDREGARAFIGLVIDRKIASSNDLTEAEAGQVLDQLTAEEARQAAEEARDRQDQAAEAPQDPPPEKSLFDDE